MLQCLLLSEHIACCLYIPSQYLDLRLGTTSDSFLQMHRLGGDVKVLGPSHPHGRPRVSSCLPD